MSTERSFGLAGRWRGAALSALLVSLFPAAAVAQQYSVGGVSARVWLDRGHEPILEHGDRVRVYYRTSQDAYVAIFHLDTNGTVRLVYPSSPHQNHWVRGGRDYRVDFPTGSRWTVYDDPGVGYFFTIASPSPFDFSEFRYAATFAGGGRYAGGGWDLGHARRAVYHDPYVAMDDFVVSLIPDWDYVPYALDFTTYNVGRSYDYPRFLCYECHGYRSFSSWNPYLAACTSFRVVIYNDPWYYPAYRYRGTRVVYVRPPVFRQPRFSFKERARGENSIPIVQARPAIISQPPRTVPRNPVVEQRRAQPTAPPTRSATPGVTPPTRSATPGVTPPTRSGVPTRGVPPTATPTRGSSGTQVAPPARTRPTQVLPGRGGSGLDDIGLRRRTEDTRSSPPIRGVDPARGASPPTRVSPPTSGARSAGPTRTSPPVRSLPPSRATPPARTTSPPRTSSGPVRTQPQATSPPVSRPPVQAQPPVRPPTQARPPVTRPPVRTGPPRTGTGGGGGAAPPPRTGTGGGGGSTPPPRTGTGGGGG